MSAEPTPEPPRSGLRNPVAAVRGVAAAALGLEGIVLLLAIVPLKVVGAHLSGYAIATVVVLAGVCLALAGLLRHRWAWYAGSVVPVLLVIAGFVFHPSLAVLGVLFGLVWLYVLSVRRNIVR